MIVINIKNMFKANDYFDLIIFCRFNSDDKILNRKYF